jgi:hypothetical protein
MNHTYTLLVFASANSVLNSGDVVRKEQVAVQTDRNILYKAI